MNQFLTNFLKNLDIGRIVAYTVLKIQSLSHDKDKGMYTVVVSYKDSLSTATFFNELEARFYELRMLAEIGQSLGLIGSNHTREDLENAIKYIDKETEYLVILVESII